MATHSIILFWVTKSWIQPSNFHFHFHVWEDVTVWAHWNHSFHISAIWRQHPVIFPILNSSVLTVGNDCSLMVAWSQVLFSFLLVLRARNSHLEGQNLWWLRHPCLLIWQEVLCFSRWTWKTSELYFCISKSFKKLSPV